jgi:hypothetical protein
LRPLRCGLLGEVVWGEAVGGAVVIAMNSGVPF